jgi:excisionase family DNA binding protein
MMTIAEAAEMMHTTPRALYQRIRRGQMPGVVRVGAHRLMVKTNEYLREPRMPTVE